MRRRVARAAWLVRALLGWTAAVRRVSQHERQCRVLDSLMIGACVVRGDSAPPALAFRVGRTPARTSHATQNSEHTGRPAGIDISTTRGCAAPSHTDNTTQASVAASHATQLAARQIRLLLRSAFPPAIAPRAPASSTQPLHAAMQTLHAPQRAALHPSAGCKHLSAGPRLHAR